MQFPTDLKSNETILTKAISLEILSVNWLMQLSRHLNSWEDNQASASLRSIERTCVRLPSRSMQTYTESNLFCVHRRRKQVKVAPNAFDIKLHFHHWKTNDKIGRQLFRLEKRLFTLAVTNRWFVGPEKIQHVKCSCLLSTINDATPKPPLQTLLPEWMSKSLLVQQPMANCRSLVSSNTIDKRTLPSNFPFDEESDNIETIETMNLFRWSTFVSSLKKRKMLFSPSQSTSNRENFCKYFVTYKRKATDCSSQQNSPRSIRVVRSIDENSQMLPLQISRHFNLQIFQSKKEKTFQLIEMKVCNSSSRFDWPEGKLSKWPTLPSIECHFIVLFCPISECLSSVENVQLQLCLRSLFIVESLAERPRFNSLCKRENNSATWNKRRAPIFPQVESDISSTCCKSKQIEENTPMKTYKQNHWINRHFQGKGKHRRLRRCSLSPHAQLTFIQTKSNFAEICARSRVDLLQSLFFSR